MSYTCSGWTGSCRCLADMSGLQTLALLPRDTRVRLAPLSPAGPNKMSWLARPHSEVSPVVFTAPLTLLSSTNSITSLTPFQTNCIAQLMANTFHHHLLSRSSLHLSEYPLCTAQGLTEAVNNERFSEYLLWIWTWIVWHITTGRNSCWSVRRTLMGAVMMKPGWHDLLVHNLVQRSHRKYFHMDFLGTWHERHRGLTL